MTEREDVGPTDDRGDELRARRAELETDLIELADLLDEERSKWEERRIAARAGRENVRAVAEDEEDDARMAWYAAEYQDAQQTIVVMESLIERHNQVALALTACQQELMQLTRDHRRGSLAR